MNTPHTIIIAEAGVNHNGNLDMAREMIHVARDAGADYVKFQTAIPSQLVSTGARKAEYQEANTGSSESQLDMLSRLMLPFDDFISLREECLEAGIGFLSTPFDLDSVRFLARLGMDFAKVPSGEITNLPYLRAVARWGIPVILSCGMSVPEEIENAILILTGSHPSIPSRSSLSRNDITLLHCNTQYPTPMQDVNLLAMPQLGNQFGVRFGYSDHTPGIEVDIAAVALGAHVIEKHFTLDRSLPGPDHRASLEPHELKAMVSAIRNIEVALGSNTKSVSDSERPNRNVARKSIVAARDINRGEILSGDNITTKRPGDGLSPMRWDEVIGTPAKRNFRQDEQIEL